MIPDGTDFEIILAMNIHADASADSRIHRPRYNRRPPAIFEHVLPKLFDRDAGFHSDDSGLRIPTENPVHARSIEDDIFCANGGVSITSACSPRSYLTIHLARQSKNFTKTFDRRR